MSSANVTFLISYLLHTLIGTVAKANIIIDVMLPHGWYWKGKPVHNEMGGGGE